MKIPSEPDDELLKSLVEESNTLPRAAAVQARHQRQKRANSIRVVTALMILFFAGAIWFSRQTSRSKVEKEMVNNVKPSEPARSPARQGYVKVHQTGEAIEPAPIPPDASEREKRLLTELPGVPLLIVKNDAGEVARVHIFER